MGRPGLLSQGKERKYEIQNLWDKHHQVLRMCALGVDRKDIAARTGLSPTMVSTITNSTLGREALTVMRGTLDKGIIDISQAIHELAPKAVEVLEELLEAENEKVRLTAAMDVLDRAGHAAQKNINLSVTHKVTQEDIEAIKQRAMESGLLAVSITATEGRVGEGIGRAGGVTEADAVDVEFKEVAPSAQREE